MTALVINAILNILPKKENNMRKFALALSVFMLVICFASCSNSDECSNKMDTAIDFFKDNGFTQSQEYTKEQIVSIEVNFKIAPSCKLNHTILRINHLIKPYNDGTFDYVYVYLFENSDDCMSIYNNYAKLNSEYAKISDRVLVFGNSEVVNQLEM